MHCIKVINNNILCLSDTAERGKARRVRVSGTGTKETGIVTESAATEKSTSESGSGNGATGKRSEITTKSAVAHTATEVGKTRRSRKPMSSGPSWAWHPSGLRRRKQTNSWISVCLLLHCIRHGILP